VFEEILFQPFGIGKDWNGKLDWILYKLYCFASKKIELFKYQVK